MLNFFKNVNFALALIIYTDHVRRIFLLLNYFNSKQKPD